MESLPKTLKDKKLVNDTNYAFLSHNTWGEIAELFTNQLKKLKLSQKHTNRYSNELKSFAMTVDYYSPKAYEFI